MTELDLIVFDDALARDWYPFTLTRPAGELMLGTLTMRARIEQVTRANCSGYVSSPDLAGFSEEGAPPLLDAATLTADKTTLFISARFVPAWDAAIATDRESTLQADGAVVGWVVPAGAAPPSEQQLQQPSERRGATQHIKGKLIGHVWDLVHENVAQITDDISHFHPGAQCACPPNVFVFGSHPLVCSEGVTIEPGVVFDLTAGPIWLDEGVTVRALSRIAGPMYVGKKSSILGGLHTGSTIGPVCKVHGEVEESVILGYSNKAHEGFLGHAYLGKWVNLGAITTNSDLKNNYGPVTITTPSGQFETGMMKLGSLLGDHVKTAIGTMLYTGTVIGPGTSVFGGTPPTHVQAFSWGRNEYKLDRFFEAAERAMKRRDVELTQSQREMLTRVWHKTRAESQ